MVSILKLAFRPTQERSGFRQTPRANYTAPDLPLKRAVCHRILFEITE
jgi:hypothetical protein